MLRINRKFFFDDVRKVIFGGRLTSQQVTTLNAILDEVDATDNITQGDAAYMLATVYHEVGRALKPVRECFAKTDKQAQACVKKMFELGKVQRNYAKPHPITGKSYYGRGIGAQITHYENYERLGDALGIDLVNNPDLALDVTVGAKILVYGMVHGTFTGKALKNYEPGDFTNMRAIINGDVKTVGPVVAKIARKFRPAITWEQAPAPEPQVITQEVVDMTPAIAAMVQEGLDSDASISYGQTNLWTKFKVWLTKQGVM